MHVDQRQFPPVGRLLRWSVGIALLVLFVVLRIEDTDTRAVEAQYNYALLLFQQGYLEKSQREASVGLAQFQRSNPEWAARFQLLEAESMLFRGMYPDALALLAKYSSVPAHPQREIQKLAIDAVALVREQQIVQANQKLAQADLICRDADYAECGEVLRARGILAKQAGQFAFARQVFLETASFAEAHHDRWLHASALVNLGWIALQIDHFDEAVDWSRRALREAQELGAQDTAQTAAGNLGWAFYQLGDRERALEQFLEAEQSAEKLGDVAEELNWTGTAGYVYRDNGDLPRATQSYRRALSLAKQIDSREDIVDALEDLAQISVDSGKLDEAAAYIDQVAPMETASGGHLSANVLLTQGMLAAARRQDRQAESLFRTVQSNPDNPTTTRLGAGEQLALLFELEGDTRSAEQMYKSTLSAFDSAQAELKSEESKLPFVTNAARIYDDYIRLLVRQGRTDEALLAADRSRARTLAEGLGADADKSGRPSSAPATLNPRQIARNTGSTLLFYWLGQKQSCLWAITPERIAFFPLPARAELISRIDRYRKAVLDIEDPLQARNEDGQALYRQLVAPAAASLRPGTPITILVDGELSQLNFETLLVPDAAADPVPAPRLHYWIDDATLISAPSLAMLAAAKPSPPTHPNLLLLGNPVPPGNDFPSLPFSAFEMKNVQRHFDPRNIAAFDSRRATPAAYLASNPAQYTYIHFVSHAVSSRTDPLDSAIILSGDAAGADSFKLYARDIMRHPIGARLVTISACYGSGTRSYAGEGLVGLSWAFLRAGAQSVIGALWEVSDDSTPRLMDALYEGVHDGEPPAAALRKAKLALLHSNSKFRSPFYWAPFQLYSSR